MDRLKQLETFVAVVGRGSLSAAALAEGVAPAMIGRRLDALEERLGVKLLLRTTRKISLTFEGSAFLEDCQRIIHDVQSAEASVSAGGVKASGHLRVSAPAGFGRRHVAPLVPAFTGMHREVSVTLDLTDRIVDLVNEGFDCAVRLGELPDSSMVSLRLGETRRVCVAAPAYLAARGRPESLDDLIHHDCLVFSAVGPFTAKAGWCRSGWRAPWPAPMARYCMSGAWRAKVSPGVPGGKWVPMSRPAACRPFWTRMLRLRSGFMPSFPNGGIYRCASGYSWII